MKVVLKYAVVGPGVLSVMTTGASMMLRLFVNSLDMNQVSCSICIMNALFILKNSKCSGECLLWTREWNNPLG